MARIEKSIEVDVPLRIVYNQLTQFTEFPRFMAGVLEVRQLDDTHLHWRSKPNGEEREWDSEITEQVPDQLIAWRNLNDHANNGRVEFEAVAPDKTRVTMNMEFEPPSPADKAPEYEARIAQRTQADLQRFKDFIERRGLETGAWRKEVHSGQVTAQASARETKPGQSEAWLPRLMDAWEEPLVMMRKMTQEMDTLFERFLGRPFGISQWTSGAAARNWSPPMEVARHEDQLVIQADLPGIKREEVQVEIKGDQLIIEGDRLPQTDRQQQEYRRSERHYGHFYRVIPLPEGVDAEAASASMHDGVLEITLPVTRQPSQGRRLDINPLRDAQRTP